MAPHESRSASHASPPRKRRKLYVPSPGAVAHQVSDALLSTPSLNDVTLHTSDNQAVRACGPLLRIRCAYFRSLHEQRADVPLPAAQTLELLRFMYTGDSHVVQAAVSFLRRADKFDAWKRHDIIMHTHALVALMAAADKLQLEQLAEWCDELLCSFVNTIPSAACTLYTSLEQADVTKCLCLTTLRDVVQTSPQHAFAVPDAPTRRPPTCAPPMGDAAAAAAAAAADPDGAPALGVCDLSASGLISLSRLPFAAEHHEYVFRAIYYWGERTPLCAPPPACTGESAASMRCAAAALDVCAMRVRFISELAEPTGLLDEAALLRAYRFHACRQAGAPCAAGDDNGGGGGGGDGVARPDVKTEQQRL